MLDLIYMDNLLQAALCYKKLGFSVIGVRRNKKSYHYWKKYQRLLMPDDVISETFTQPSVEGIAIVCGEISGNLEVIDTDSKYDLTNNLFERFIDKIYIASPVLFHCLTIAVTRNKGYHFFYRCPEIGRTTTLARRQATEQEKINSPGDKIKVLIETRAKKSYAIVFPTQGYKFVQNDLSNIPLIEPAERRLLLNIAKSFNLYHNNIENTISFKPVKCFYDPLSPFDDYDQHGDVIELLQRHGWIKVHTTPEKIYFRRPGNTDHDTSGDYSHVLGRFAVFSTSTEFTARKAYKPYAVYTILECNGDFRLAAKKLLKQGYGIPYSQRC